MNQIIFSPNIYFVLQYFHFISCILNSFPILSPASLEKVILHGNRAGQDTAHFGNLVFLITTPDKKQTNKLVD